MSPLVVFDVRIQEGEVRAAAVPIRGIVNPGNTAYDEDAVVNRLLIIVNKRKDVRGPGSSDQRGASYMDIPGSR